MHVYENIYLNQLSDQQEAQTYLQALFDTQDGFEEIVEVLEYISGKSLDKIELWAPAQDDRKSFPEGAVEFHYRKNDVFRVSGNFLPDNYFGFSRGVKTA